MLAADLQSAAWPPDYKSGGSKKEGALCLEDEQYQWTRGESNLDISTVNKEE